jgi:hypothetical protein
VIGPKKLATIRQDLRRALAATGDDPIRWLEDRMADESRRLAPTGGSDVLHSLRRLLETSETLERPRKRAGTKE